MESEREAEDEEDLNWQWEPEISIERQEELLRHVASSSEDSPFQHMSLSRADIEWLLKEKKRTLSNSAMQNKMGLKLGFTDLRDINLSSLPLSNSSFLRANLKGCVLIDADLRRVNFEFTHLEDAILMGSKLGVADLRYAYFSEGTTLRDALLSDEDSGTVSICDLHWANASLSGVDT